VCDNFIYSLNFIYCSKVGPNKRGSVEVLKPWGISGLFYIYIYITFSISLLHPDRFNPPPYSNNLDYKYSQVPEFSV